VVFFNVFFKTLGFLSAILIFLIITNILLFFTNDLQNNKFTMIDGDGNSKNIIARINLNGPIFNSKH